MNDYLTCTDEEKCYICETIYADEQYHNRYNRNKVIFSFLNGLLKKLHNNIIAELTELEIYFDEQTTVIGQLYYLDCIISLFHNYYENEWSLSPDEVNYKMHIVESLFELNNSSGEPVRPLVEIIYILTDKQANMEVYSAEYNSFMNKLSTLEKELLPLVTNMTINDADMMHNCNIC